MPTWSQVNVNLRHPCAYIFFDICLAASEGGEDIFIIDTLTSHRHHTDEQRGIRLENAF